jgi:4-hydroxybenzoate polyprenyltransferase
VRLGSIVRLVRLPAVLTVPGDTLAGAAAAGWPLGRRTAALPLASALLYTGGMALNDWADRELDAVERPERPIPSGEIRPGQALAIGAGLLAGGVGVAALAGGRRALRVALPLAATVWAYDVVLKPTPLGPVAMAAARGLDVLLGAAGARRAWPAALAVSAHALATTVLSRDEVTGAAGVAPRAALGTTLALSGAVAAASGGSGIPAGIARGALAASYAGAVARPQWAAVRNPDAAHVRRAVGASVLGTVPLQAALLARGRSVPLAAAVALLAPLARVASRKVSPT